MRKQVLRRLTVAAMMWSTAVFGQTDAGTIVGSIVDSTGAIVAGAKVTATSLATGQTRATTSNATGSYELPFLAIGQYTVQVEASGFQRARVAAFQLQVGQVARVDVTMTLGEVTQSIEVSASTVELQTENATVGTVIDQQKVVQLPLNGRSFVQLALLTPGVNPVTPGSLTQRSSGGSLGQGVGMNVNGSRDNLNRYYYDGVESMSFGSYTFSFSPSIDSINEFKVQSSNYSAQTGAAPGGQINLTTKSGTSAFHGTLWEFNRNNKFTTLAPFQPYSPTAAPPRLNRNQYGANIGGPVLIPKLYNGKQNTFFFFNWESGRVVQGNFGGTAYVPPTSFRTGDFSGSPVTIFDPQTGLPFPGNVIPSNRIQGFASKFLSGWVPQPNTNEATINYRATPRSAPISQDQYTARIDHHFGQSNTLSGSYIDNFQESNAVPTYGWDGSGAQIKVRHASLTDIHVFSSSIVNEARFGYNRRRQQAFFGTTNNADYDIANLIGLPGVSSDPRNYGPPAFSLGYSVPQINSIGPAHQGNQIWQFEDNLSIRKGSHSFKLGGMILRRNQWFDEAITPRGSFVFDGRTTSGGAAAVRENTFASFLLGLATSASVSPDFFFTRLNSTWQSYYFQDDWKVTRRLTVNLGMRYEYFEPPVQRGGNVNFALNGQVPGFTASGRIFKDIPGETQYDGHPSLIRPTRRDFGPRVGFAYMLPTRRDMVLRGGYGIFYTPEIANSFIGLTFNPPIVRSLSYTGTYNQPIQAATAFSNQGSVAYGQLGASSVDPDIRDTYVQQWNLTLQSTLPGKVILDLGYVGTKGNYLPIGYDSNRPIDLVNPATTTASLASRRPLQGYSGITASKAAGNSLYHALQMKAERRLDRGFSVIGAYTWAKVLTTADQSTVGGGYYSPGIQDIYHLQNEKAPAAFDLRHRLSIAVVYDIPFFTNSHSPWLRAALGGWRLSGISTMQTGFAAALSTVGDTTGTGVSSRPSVVAGQSATLDNPTRAKWFNTAAFVSPAGGSFGNAARTSIYLPGLINVDMSASKTFKFTERLNVELRGEAFNVANHVNLGAPGLSLLTPNTFGVINSADQGSDTSGSQRVIQFGAKLHF